ncbi:hypothetical protein [Pyxidicoccus xibeiensis]|uniref:hypothetical protein n=1 Tax=Pyxidicoccus xibeiensis TaxID=2906759 RepID=UPI0020A81FB8|nr:hypothetical protein [Pyxidicoccus xibeiensis]MCP3140694.1 hypothetical protein [Pyxidicoccus xibeiensis]
MSPKTSVLEPLRVRVRRFQFIVGLGFLALVGGSVLSVSLAMRLSARVQTLPLGFMRVLMAVLLENLWVLGVLPLLCYGAARVMELKPWSTAAGSATSGAVFVLALNFVQSGADGLWLGGLMSVLNLAAFAVGIVLSARAVKLGRAAAAQQTVKAQAKAQERKSEYDEFLRAAEQGGERLEQREAASQATPSEQPQAEAATDTPKNPAA